MGRRKKGRPVNGWVVVDKPKGATSTQVVSIVRRVFDAKKAGHGGTLDPLASGILPIALGEATKTVPYTMDALKSYEFTVRWGQQRSTDDLEGEIIARSDVRPTTAQIVAQLGQFIGDISQVPPAFSAIKVDGERAYDLAREGEKVELKARPVFVERLELLDQPDDDHASFLMVCGKGTYVRSLGRDLALKLGTVGTISALRRTNVGPFDTERAISLEQIEEMGNSPPPELSELPDWLLPVETALDDIPALALTGPDAQRMKQGNEVRVTRMMANDLAGYDLSQDPTVRVHDFTGCLIAIAQIDKGAVKPMRVFNF